jgi:Na+/H+ antiporter NhaD/arsenite permease-like protein
MIETLRSLAVTAVIVLSLLGIAVGRLPRLRMNRATMAFTGAAFLIVLGAIPAEEAFRAVDLNTLVLILSMMIVTANLKFAGFFVLAGNAILRAARTPRRLLALVMAASAVLSALFLNDTICIVLTPLVAGLCVRAKRKAAPYLIALALAANLGSAATIIGNPQNMLIGASSGIPFLRFFLRLAFPAFAGTAIAYAVVSVVFRKEFAAGQRIEFVAGTDARETVNRPLLLKCGAAILIMIAAFLTEIPVAVASMVAAGLLLTTRRVKPERVFAELDWTIIAFFGGLFVITEAIARSSGFDFLVARGLPAVGQDMARFSVFTLVLSNLVSNVPAVMLMRPLVDFFADREKAWLVMAMASTFAGNLTLLGSVANLIVAETGKRYGIEIGFGEYLKAGLPTTILTTALGVAWFALT